MSTSTWEFYGDEVEKMVEVYPVPAGKLHAAEFAEWAAESYDASASVVYPGKPPTLFLTFISLDFVSGQAPDDEYRAQAEPVARSRIMYGGARLADLMVQIFG